MKCRNCGYEQEKDFENHVTYIPIYEDDEHLIKFEWRSMCPKCGTINGMNCPSIVEKSASKALNIDRITNLIFDLLNEYDIGLWEDIDYVELADKWCELVDTICAHNQDLPNRDNLLKAELKKYLIGDA